MAAAVLETGPPACVLLHACSRRHYGRELAAWNLETGKCHVFGEDSGYNRRAMLVYTGEPGLDVGWCTESQWGRISMHTGISICVSIVLLYVYWRLSVPM